MKKLVALIGIIALAGCGVKTEDNRDSLSKTQRAEIDERTKSYGVVGVSSEPVGYFTGPYVVHGTVIEPATEKTVITIVKAPGVTTGEVKYTACAACHGAQGQGGVGPMLSGQDPDYIVSRLTAYRNKEQIGAQSALMWGQASSLSDDDIQSIAEYISTL